MIFETHQVRCAVSSAVFHQGPSVGRFYLQVHHSKWGGLEGCREFEKRENPRSGESSRGEEVDMGSNLEELWILHVDGSSSATNIGAGFILTTPEGEVVGYVLRFDFSTTNNEMEYKALLVELRLTLELGK